MENFMELDMKKALDPKAVIFGVWELKISLGKFRSNRLIKPS